MENLPKLILLGSLVAALTWGTCIAADQMVAQNKMRNECGKSRKELGTTLKNVDPELLVTVSSIYHVKFEDMNGILQAYESGNNKDEIHDGSTTYKLNQESDDCAYVWSYTNYDFSIPRKQFFRRTNGKWIVDGKLEATPDSS